MERRLEKGSNYAPHNFHGPWDILVHAYRLSIGFTFYSSSIKSTVQQVPDPQMTNLHSTLVLLKDIREQEEEEE